MKKWGGIVDSLINNLVFETRDIHLRQAGAKRKAGGRGAEGERKMHTDEEGGKEKSGED